MAETEQCSVCETRVRSLEESVQQLLVRMALVEEGMKAVEEMKSHLCRLERSVERALEVLLPRVDALLTGLEATSGPLPPATTASTANTTTSAKNNPKGKSGAAKGAANGAELANAKGSGERCEMAVSVRQAASAGDLETLRFWLARGANETPLAAAAAAGNIDAVKALLFQQGASRAKQVKRALRVAGTPEMVRELAKMEPSAVRMKQGGGVGLQVAAASGRLAVMRALLDVGADPNCTDKDGMTALHHASVHGQTDCLRVLLDKGVNLNVQDRCGRTPLHHAAQHGHKECLAALMARGADLGSRDNNSWTPLHVASREGKADCVEALLTGGAAVDSLDKEGWTPLIYAVDRRHKEVERLLLAAGATPETPARLEGSSASK
ncbi:Protein fem-1 homolog B [Gryllus bimaculatus]|nr:Protein fem-1 homolog B [Gryllus bimaculatus]